VYLGRTRRPVTPAAGPPGPQVPALPISGGLRPSAQP
jgi:hypothetical protein